MSEIQLDFISISSRWQLVSPLTSDRSLPVVLSACVCLCVCVNRFKRWQISINEIIKMRLRLCWWRAARVARDRGCCGVEVRGHDLFLSHVSPRQTSPANCLGPRFGPCSPPGPWSLSVRWWLLVRVSTIRAKNENLHNYCSIFFGGAAVLQIVFSPLRPAQPNLLITFSMMRQ